MLLDVFTVKGIVGKPWISVGCGHDVVHACNYICSNRLSFYIGSGYWAILNKEDFPGPRPVFHGKPRRHYCKFWN